jgi:hypothetical protein
MSTRFASGPGALASLVRESQDLAAAWRDQDKALLDAVSNHRPEVREERARIDALRKRGILGEFLIDAFQRQAASVPLRP